MHRAPICFDRICCCNDGSVYLWVSFNWLHMDKYLSDNIRDLSNSSEVSCFSLHAEPSAFHWQCLVQVASLAMVLGDTLWKQFAKRNTVKISGPNRRAKVTDHFTCISVNVIYCITYTLGKKIYIGETGRRLADHKHLRDVEKNDTDASKPVARRFNLPNHSRHNMIICRLSLHHGNTESRKTLEQKFPFQLGTLSPHEINECLLFH